MIGWLFKKNTPETQTPIEVTGFHFLHYHAAKKHFSERKYYTQLTLTNLIKSNSSCLPAHPIILNIGNQVLIGSLFLYLV
ncbi:hypothetical protein Asal01_00241 [Fodinibius salicampi]